MAVHLGWLCTIHLSNRRLACWTYLARIVGNLHDAGTGITLVATVTSDLDLQTLAADRHAGRAGRGALRAISATAARHAGQI